MRKMSRSNVAVVKSTSSARSEVIGNAPRTILPRGQQRLPLLHFLPIFSNFTSEQCLSNSCIITHVDM